MKQKDTLPALASPTAGLVLPEQLAQQAADAVRELLAEALVARQARQSGRSGRK